MKFTMNLWFWAALGTVSMIAFRVNATTVGYTLDNVILADTTQMTGTFSWTFTSDFENGVGQWSSLEIPWTSHNQDDLNTTFDLGSSIEITLEGSVHDDGVDITLFLLQPLTPNTSSSIDLARSKYEIGGNGFHDGSFLSGSIVPILSGDMNGDDLLTDADIPLFVEALTDRAAYDAHEFGLDADMIGDVNQDGNFNLGDVNAFKALLDNPDTAHSAAVPEPTTITLLSFYLLAFVSISRHRS